MSSFTALTDVGIIPETYDKGRMMGRTQNRQVIVKRSVKEVTRTVSELFNGVVGEAVGQRGVCNLALAGGTTPHALYQHLAGVATSEELPRRDVEIFFRDERDSGLSPSNIAAYYRMLVRASEIGGIHRIYFVTHNEMLAEMADARMVFTKEGVSVQ